jgi:outer membrane protein assembly factor BamB
MEDYGNGWYRCTFVQTATSTGASSVQIFLSSDTSITLTGEDGTKGVYVWGVQVETGARATSYIQTIGATATRAQDYLTLATSEFPFGATEGTVYVEGVNPRSSGTFVAAQLDDGTENERFRFSRTAGGNQISTVTDGGASQASIVAGASVAEASFKMAFAYAENDFASSLDGAAAVTDTAGTLPTVTTLRIGSQVAGASWGYYIKKVAYYPVRLSDAQLQTLTS